MRKRKRKEGWLDGMMVGWLEEEKGDWSQSGN